MNIFLAIHTNTLSTRASPMGSHLPNKDLNMLRTPIGGREKKGYLLVTDNYIRTLSLQQLTSPMVKIRKKIDKSWSQHLKFM